MSVFILKPLMGAIPATQKQISIPIAHGVEINDEGQSSREWVMMDGTSLMGQLGQPYPGPVQGWVRRG